MFRFTRRARALFYVATLLLALPAVCAAQGPAPQANQEKTEEPPFHEYKGVKIGMTADEARKKLGNPTDKGDKQDYYALNDNETCEVYYGDDKKVYAVKVTYLGGNAIPAPKNILGIEADSKQDGSLYKMLRFPKVGYWVSYMRTAGDSPMTLVTLQKIQ
ncbi:MAG TPA: hypothetical protein VM914_11205 [Pyrinomonadaceae bacterium]|nr:hypothetical protein [Pyrinomonadaceae bacterium]